MNSKLNIQELSEQIAKELDISIEDVSAFLDAMFLLIYDTLLTGEEVRVKGIGVFKLALVDKRESIDVNSGERIEIPQHYKVAFTPDGQLKEAVNKPFSIFDTIDLSDTADEVVLDTHELELLDKVENANAQQLESDTVSERNKAKSHLRLSHDELSDKGQLGDNVLIVKGNEIDNVAVNDTDFEPSELLAGKMESEDDVQMYHDASEHVAEVENKSDILSREVPVEEENEMPRLIQDAILAAKAEWNKEQSANKELLPCDIIKSGKEDEHVCNYPHRGVFSVSLLILLAGFAMGGMCVYCYFLGKNIENKSSLINQSVQSLPQPEELTLDTIKTEIVANFKDTVIEVKNDSANLVSITASENNDSDLYSIERDSDTNKDLPIQVQLKKGMRLALLAEQYYGNKVFWVYIYEANKDVIKNPNILPIGGVINIPERSRYSINAKDSISLEKARKLQSQLLGRFE